MAFVAALVVAAGLVADAAHASCEDDVEVLGATATYHTRTFKGQSRRRDVEVQVKLRSTSTTAISSIDLGVFLGASLEAVNGTRAAALPSKQLREFDEGGVAFRVRAEVMLPAGATRSVEVTRSFLPLEQDLVGVKVVPVGCTRIQPVSDVRIVMPAASEAPSRGLVIAAVLCTVAAAVVLLRRLR